MNFKRHHSSSRLHRQLSVCFLYLRKLAKKGQVRCVCVCVCVCTHMCMYGGDIHQSLGFCIQSFFFKINFYWRIVASWYSVSFCSTAKWISYTYTYISPFWDFISIQVTTKHLEFPVLYSRFSLVIHFIHSPSIHCTDHSSICGSGPQWACVFAGGVCPELRAPHPAWHFLAIRETKHLVHLLKMQAHSDKRWK